MRTLTRTVILGLALCSATAMAAPKLTPTGFVSIAKTKLTAIPGAKVSLLGPGHSAFAGGKVRSIQAKVVLPSMTALLKAYPLLTKGQVPSSDAPVSRMRGVTFVMLAHH